MVPYAWDNVWEITNLYNLMELILGAGISLFIQWLKHSLNLKGYAVLGAVVVISIAASAVYTFLVYKGLWETFYTVLVTAGAFYAFIIKRFDEDLSK